MASVFTTMLLLYQTLLFCGYSELTSIFFNFWGTPLPPYYFSLHVDPPCTYISKNKHEYIKLIYMYMYVLYIVHVHLKP